MALLKKGYICPTHGVVGIPGSYNVNNLWDEQEKRYDICERCFRDGKTQVVKEQ